MKSQAGHKKVAASKSLMPKMRKPLRHEFVLEALLPLETRTRSMLGCLAGGAPTAWQNLPSGSDRFEEEALRAYELMLRGDPRIGKIPSRKRARK